MNKNKKKISGWTWFFGILILILLVILLFWFLSPHPKKVAINEFQKDVTDQKSKNNLQEVVFIKQSDDNYRVELVTVDRKIPEYTVMGQSDGEQYSQTLTTNGISVNYSEPSKWVFWLSLFFNIIPFLFFGVLIYLAYRSFKNAGGGIGGIGLPSKKVAPKASKSSVRFRDVAGYTEEKFELTEIVEFLKQPDRYKTMGIKVPKGVLLVGEPGTGKTLLAKAVAGEANVPFFSTSGGEFVEMFIGLGAARMRELFKSAKEQQPCIIFIDEIDTIGKTRTSGSHGGNDEREQTLNELLVQMDGFESNESIIIMGATNRDEILDRALLRPGRFDRKIRFHSPTKDERKAILLVHARNKNISPDVDFDDLARKTPGYSGALLENLMNEAGILAVRAGKNVIEQEEIDEATDRVIGGVAKKSKKYIEEEKKLVAYHESGHALVGLLLEGSNKVEKITIIPRGSAGGYTLFSPKEEKFFTTKKEMLDTIVGYLAGRAAEELIFGEDNITTGAQNDIEHATHIARNMVTQFGMSDLGMVQYERLNQDVYGVQQISDNNLLNIETNVKDTISLAYKKAHKLIKDHRSILDLLAEALIKNEILNANEIEYIFKHKKLPNKEDINQKDGKKHTLEEDIEISL